MMSEQIMAAASLLMCFCYMFSYVKYRLKQIYKFYIFIDTKHSLFHQIKISFV